MTTFTRCQGLMLEEQMIDMEGDYEALRDHCIFPTNAYPFPTNV